MTGPMDVGREIAAAMGAIEQERAEDTMRAQYRASMKVLRTIPSGTPDSNLTDEQRAAVKAHREAVDWMMAQDWEDE